MPSANNIPWFDNIKVLFFFLTMPVSKYFFMSRSKCEAYSLPKEFRICSVSQPKDVRSDVMTYSLYLSLRERDSFSIMLLLTPAVLIYCLILETLHCRDMPL